MSDHSEPPDAAATSDLLASADQDHANRILRAMHEAAQGATMATVWWAVAQAQAAVLANMPSPLQLWLAARLAEMCQVALPAAILAAARARGEDVSIPERLN